jgi:hypothetical protein
MTAYRYSGGVSDPVGNFLTNADTISQISSPAAASIALRLPPGATAAELNAFVIPTGTQIFIDDSRALVPLRWNKREFVRQLRITADVLRPLTENYSRGALVWNGTEYSPATVPATAHPRAMAWWAILMTMEGLLDTQDGAPNERQIAYIKDTLFGGMGSFNDLTFDVKDLPAAAATINQRLDQQRDALYAAFMATPAA